MPATGDTVGRPWWREVLLTPGYRVQPSDKVTFEGKPMKPQVKKVYVLLNKPKGFITTTDDEMDRRTVMELDVDEIGPSLRFATANV